MEEVVSGLIHEILYLRKMYPEQAFKRNLVLGCPCWTAEPEDICNYIATVVQAIKLHLDKRNLKAVHLAISSPKFGLQQVFSFNFQQTQGPAKDTGLEAYFQAFIWKLNYACVSLDDLPFDSDPDISWLVQNVQN